MGYKKLTDAEEKQLVKEYISGASVVSLMQKYGYKTKKSITDKVKKYYPDNFQEKIINARDNRKDYQITFEGVTDNFSAYFLGLMLTDGYIQDDNKFGIDLTDEDCVKFISDVTGKTYNHYDDKENKKTRYRLVFSNKEVVKKLEEYGVMRRKSKIIPAISLSEKEQKFLPYLIRGIIDGDGCIYKTSYGAPAMYICSASEEFIRWIKGILENKFFFYELSMTQNNEGVWRIDTANQLNILKLISIVYPIPYGMSRKYELLRKTFRDYNKDNLLIS